MICAFSGCDNEFTPNSKKNQKYCSYECSVKANNQRLTERYHRRKEILDTPKRKCATVGCPTILRRTNVGEYCDPCQQRAEDQRKKAFRRLVLGNDQTNGS